MVLVTKGMVLADWNTSDLLADMRAYLDLGTLCLFNVTTAERCTPDTTV